MYMGSYEPLVNTSTAACHVAHNKRSAEKSADQPDCKYRLSSWRGMQTEVSKKSTGQLLKPRTAQFTGLPYEIVRHIAARLSAQSIGALSQTCHYLHTAVGGMAVDKMADHYYGPLNSESRHQYDRLYSPLAKRLFATKVPDCPVQQGSATVDALPLSEEQQAKQRLRQITRLRILSHNGKLNPTGVLVFKQAGHCKLLACGVSKHWGICALICAEKLGELYHPWPWYHGYMLRILIVEPTLCSLEVPLIGGQDHPHSVLNAEIVADGHIVIVMESRIDPICFLTVCSCTESGEPELRVLAGSHSETIVRFGQLPDGRIISASMDGTLKIRPLKSSDESQVTTLKVHQGARITDMLIMADSRCVTSSVDQVLTVWDLRCPQEERCVAVLTEIPDHYRKLYRLSDTRFLAENSPYELLVWQLTDNGATCTTVLDPDWPISLPPGEKRTGREPPYDLTDSPDFLHEEFYSITPLQCLPDGSVVVTDHEDSIRLYHPTAHNSGPQRVCIIERNDNGDVSRTLPLCPVGPLLWPPATNVHLLAPLADGRLVQANSDGTLHAYSPNNINAVTVKGVRLGNLFSCLPPKYKTEAKLAVDEMACMDDGRLLVNAWAADQKTRFFVYDPYAPAKSSDNPAQED